MSGSGKKIIAVFALSLLMAAALLTAPAQSSQLGAAPFLSPSAAVHAVGKPALEPSAPSAVVADSCLALLQMAAPDAAGTGPQPVRPEAGPAAALGLIFGVQYALGPKETTRANQGLKGSLSGDVSGDRALAVAEYRRCRNEQLLKTL